MLALGGVGDVVFHSFSGLPERLGHSLHLLTFVGMVFTMAGVLIEAFRAGRGGPKGASERPISGDRIKS